MSSEHDSMESSVRLLLILILRPRKGASDDSVSQHEFTPEITLILGPGIFFQRDDKIREVFLDLLYLDVEQCSLVVVIALVDSLRLLPDVDLAHSKGKDKVTAPFPARASLRLSVALDPGLKADRDGSTAPQGPVQRDPELATV